MLELKKMQAKVTNVNPRVELHGGENELACDLSIAMVVSNDILEKFADDLKAMLYMQGDAPDGETETLDFDENHLPNLRFPSLEPIKWKYEGVGYRVKLHLGLDAESDIILPDSKINSFKFDCKQGGSVHVTFRVQFYPADKDIDLICHYLNDSVDISLEPPEEGELAEVA